MAVPSGGIGGDMIFYYTEPRAGNLWVFALDGGPRALRQETNLTPLPGGLPRVGEPGHTLGGRVLPGYGFEPTEGSDPITTTPPTLPGATAAPAAAAPAAPPHIRPRAHRRPRTPAAAPAIAAGEVANPLLGDAGAISAGERIYRSRCVVCHRAGGGAGPSLFRNTLPTGRFLDTVRRGREGTSMPAFEELLSGDEMWQVHAFLMSRDSL